MRLEAFIKKVLSSTPKSYAPPPEAVEEYKAAYAKWYEDLSVERKNALRIRRRRTKGTGYELYGFSYFLHIYLTVVSTYRFVSENFKDAVGNSMVEKTTSIAAKWKLVPIEEKQVCCLILGVNSF
jgi:hypothetical protein